MMRKTLRYLLLTLICLSGKELSATHIVGGEMNYKLVGPDTYEISLTVYRDCWNGVPPFDSPASVGVFNSSGMLVRELLIPFVELDTLPVSLNSCGDVPVEICYEVTTYFETVYLPSIPGGYDLVYQRCCRNWTIANIIAPEDAGATYRAHIPEALENSNPVFNQWPPTFLCVNQEFAFDHSASDADGDSLVYALYTPLSMVDGDIDPMPQPPLGGPYPNISWNPGYSEGNMLGGIPLQIDASTGYLTATPNLTGQFVIGIKVQEYRNGILLSEVYRDFQFNIVECPTVSQEIEITEPTCAGENLILEVVNPSSGGEFEWSIEGEINETLTGIGPHTIPTTTDGEIQINFQADIEGCIVNVSNTINVPPSTEAEALFSASDLSGCSPLDISFINQSDQGSYLWSFGDGSSTTSTSPSHTYTEPGTYEVSLVVEPDEICSIGGEASLTIEVHSIPEPNYIPSYTICEGDSTNLVLFNQDEFDLYDENGIEVNQMLLSQDGYYEFSASHNGCSTDFYVTVSEIQSSYKSESFEVCYPEETKLINNEIYDNYYWSTGETSESITVIDTGLYTLTLIDDFGCKHFKTFDISPYKNTYELWIPDAFSPNGDGINDNFLGDFIGLEDYSLRIFDRWGNLIFFTNDCSKSWNGEVLLRDNTSISKIDVYVYQIKYRDLCNMNRIETIVGHVSVLR